MQSLNKSLGHRMLCSCSDSCAAQEESELAKQLRLKFSTTICCDASEDAETIDSTGVERACQCVDCHIGVGRGFGPKGEALHEG